MESAEYERLRQKVDVFSAAVQARRAADMQCRRGCAGCCRDGLTVCGVEAAAIRAELAGLDAAVRAAVRARAEVGEEPEGVEGEEGSCVFLDGEGSCVIYAARPLVCRTQGLPLRYPAELIPIESVRARGRQGADAVTWCPLNFEDAERPPLAGDVLDAERVDRMLALINRAHEAGRGDALVRIGMRELAREE